MSDLPTSREVKSLSRDDLLYILGDKYKFKTPPMTHQLASILWGKYRDSVNMLHDIGTGKTLTALYLTQIWDCDRVLVVCPCSVRLTWRDEIKKHTDFCCQILDGESEVRRNLVENDFSKFHILNYEGLKTCFGKKVIVPSKSKGTKKVMKHVVDMDRVLQMPYDCLVIDESHHTKSYSAIQSILCYHLARQVKKVIMMTGTPLARDIRDFWSELKILDDGATLGPNEFEFLHTYMNRIEIKTRTHRFFEWVPKKGATDEVTQKVSAVSLRYDAYECCDMPEVTYERRYVDTSDEQRQIIKAVLSGLKTELAKNELTIKNVINRSMKLAQISSGFVLDDTGAKLLKSNPKLDELLDLLEEVSGKCIIFHHYVESGRLIEAALKKAKITFRSARGETKNKLEQISNFQNDPDVRILVAHPQSGGEGLNCQCAHVEIFYDQISAGATLREQCEGRIVRQGQKAEHCVIIDLLLKDSKSNKESMDEHIFYASRNKRDVAQAILEYIRNA